MSTATLPAVNADSKPTMGETAGEAVCDLVTRYWPLVLGMIEKKNGQAQGVGISLKFKRIADGTHRLTTKIRFSDSTSDEREDVVGEDPKQSKLSLGDLKKASK